MERTTILVVGPDGMVMVEALETGVPGLMLASPPTSDGWALVHVASGLAVSRSARGPDPEVLATLARRLAPLADWTQVAIPIPGPVLRREIDRVVEETGLALAHRTSSDDPIWTTEQDRDLLAMVLRNVHTAVPPRTFAKAIGELNAEERAHLRSLLTDQPADAGGVVQSLPQSEPQSSIATQPVQESGPGSAAG
jgi:hypothetical protein